MKSITSRILGVVMTLAILVGLLVPMASSPAPVSAGNMSWTQIDTPNFTTGQINPASDVDFLAVAPDGKTMFSYSNVSSTVLTANVTTGAAVAPPNAITVNSTEGFPAAGAIMLPGEAGPVFYAAKTATSFTGIPGTTVTVAAGIAAAALTVASNANFPATGSLMVGGEALIYTAITAVAPFVFTIAPVTAVAHVIGERVVLTANPLGSLGGGIINNHFIGETITPVSTTLTAPTAGGDAALAVTSTAGFPAAGNLVLSNPAVGVDYTINYAGPATALTFPVITGAGTVGSVQGVFPVAGTTVTIPQGKLLKSTDGGATWSGSNMGVGLNGNPITSLAISSDYATDTTIVAAGAATDFVYRSQDGGQNFGPMARVAGMNGAAANLAGTDQIRSVAVAGWYKGGQGVLAGYADEEGAAAGSGGVSVLTTIDLQWVDLTVNAPLPGPQLLASWAAGVTGGDVLAVAFSPSHKTDAQIIVVSSTAAPGMFIKTRFGTNAWDIDVDLLDAPGITADNVVAGIAANANLRASLAFPKDYDWSTNNRVLVGIGRAPIGVFALTGHEDVYRIQGALAGSQSRSFDLNASGAAGTPTNVSSVAFKGNIADGTCVVGQYADRTVLTSANIGSSPVTWVTGSKNPGLDAARPNVQVLVSPTEDLIYAATIGTSSGLFTSMDKGVSFDGVSLLDVSAANRMRLTTGYGVIDKNTQFLLMTDDADNSGTAPNVPFVVPAAGYSSNGDYHMLFKTVDAGKTWKMVLSIRQVGAFRLSSFAATRTYATDQTVYAWQSNNRFWKTSNGGSTWTGYTAQENITGFGIIDKDTYFTGHNNAVYKAGRFTAATIDGETAFIIRMLDANTLAVSSTGGDLLISTDDGVTFTRVGPADGMAGLLYYGPDPKYATNKILYGMASGGGVYRWRMGQSSTWELVINDMGPATAAIPEGSAVAPDVLTSAFDISPDGSLYVGSSVAGVGIIRQVNPSIDLGKINNNVASGVESPWEQMSNARIQGLSVNPANATIVQLRRVTDAGVNNMYAIVANIVDSPGAFGYRFRLQTLTDNMINPPEINAPKAGTVVNPNVTFSWKAVTSPVQVSYRYEIATDAQMAGQLGLPLNVTDGTSFQAPAAGAAAALVQGNPYWWRVRVNAAAPLASRYTPGTAFTVRLGQTAVALSIITPDPTKALEQPIRPIFQWSSVQSAESYELEVADNPFFANAQAKKPLMNTVWAWDKDLNYSTTYYFRVRAIAGKNASDWVQGVFVTMAELKPAAAPAAPPAPPKAPPAPPAPPPAPKFFDSQSGLYFNSDAELKAYQAAHPPQPPPTTPGYIWAIIIIGAILVIAVIVLIIRTRRVA